MSANGLFAVNVARPSRWGNPFVVLADPHFDYSPLTRDEAVRMFRAHVNNDVSRAAIKRELRGKNLACWCPLGEPCHADVLLEIANK